MGAQAADHGGADRAEGARASRLWLGDTSTSFKPTHAPDVDAARLRTDSRRVAFSVGCATKDDAAAVICHSTTTLTNVDSDRLFVLTAYDAQSSPCQWSFAHAEQQSQSRRGIVHAEQEEERDRSQADFGARSPLISRTAIASARRRIRLSDQRKADVSSPQQTAFTHHPSLRHCFACT